MSDQRDVRRIALSLPGATEEGSGYRVNGRQFVWTYPERVDPKKPKVLNPGVLCVRVDGEAEKQALLETDPGKFFTTDHYNGYAAVLVRLSEVDADELTELITDAWRTRASRDLQPRLGAGGGDSGRRPAGSPQHRYQRRIFMSDDVVDLIQHDHRELEQLFDKLESDQGDKAELLRQVADELVPHSKAEETVVYPAIRKAVPREAEDIHDGVAEHKHIEEMLETLLGESPDAPGADGMLAAMIAEVKHHVEEEEQDILPAYKGATTQEQRDDLGRRFREAKDKARATGGPSPSGDKTREELYEQARKAGVKGRSDMSKDELAQAVEESSS